MTIHLAAGYRRDRLSESRAVVDASGRHRLAQAAENLGAADRGLSYTRDSPVFMRLLLMHSDLSYGILHLWMPLSCRISIHLMWKR